MINNTHKILKELQKKDHTLNEVLISINPNFKAILDALSTQPEVDPNFASLNFELTRKKGMAN